MPSPTGWGSICPSHQTKCSCCDQELLESATLLCSHCGQVHCSSDSRTCACGLSGCSRCVAEEGCPTCRELSEIPGSDERAAVVKAWFPKLNPVRWRSNENAQEILVEWTERSGQWGLVAYSKSDRLFRFAYRYGALSAFFQRLLGRRGKKDCA
ncbi:MAG TPA: hypothetical protein DD435_03615 [Cyanobacteria bacterium UBA8530]|nr:hypothetical protein [Cyanobacteria bacterium UBA8530]